MAAGDVMPSEIGGNRVPHSGGDISGSTAGSRAARDRCLEQFSFDQNRIEESQEIARRIQNADWPQRRIMTPAAACVRGAALRGGGPSAVAPDS